jgi:hypothetical protein
MTDRTTRYNDRRNGRTDLRTLDEHAGRTDVYALLDAVAGQGHDGGRGLEAPARGTENDEEKVERGEDEQRARLVTDGGQVRANDTARARRWADVAIRSDEEKDEEVNLVKYVERRASFLRREYGLDDNLARALGWRELGFSTSGVADMMDISEGTARKYLDEVREEVGEENVDRVARPVGDRDVDEPLTGVATTNGRAAA